MIDADEIDTRRREIDASDDLMALRARLVERALPVLRRMPPIPDVKALLSRDGGVCPTDGTALTFDPWSPHAHRCPVCGSTHSGERHHAHWARAQHLWLAERAAHLATVHALTGDVDAAARARELLAAYYDRYHRMPNRDNVLGPGHLFFSTYLESIWILDYMAAAHLLRQRGVLDDDDIGAINAIADEAATIIGEFGEGMSNRQTWNSAALTAIAVWFGDDDLAATAVTGRHGLLGHLADGFRADGMWHEGENYHLFAMRGLLLGLQWAAVAGAELLHDDELAAHLGIALMAPAVTALPDHTFPARKDARFGVSLAHPAYIECWEAGLSLLGTRAPEELPGWLDTLYRAPVRSALTYDAYLHEAGEPAPTHRTRADLSWWAAWMMPAHLPGVPPQQVPAYRNRVLDAQGLALLRHGDRYVSFECIGGGDGHGHPDRLHLSLHAGGVHWLADPGAGSYLTRDLFWYRSTLAHNAPRLDSEDQPLDGAASCTAFDANDSWASVTGRWGPVQRTIVTGPRWIVDVITLETATPRVLDLPWHLAGEIDVLTDGSWSRTDVEHEFVSDMETFAPTRPGPILVRATAGDRTLALHLAGDATLLRATGPGLPGAPRTPFVIQRVSGATARLSAVIDPIGGVTSITASGDDVIVHEGDTWTTVLVAPLETVVTVDRERTVLTGARPVLRLAPVILGKRPDRARAAAMRVPDAPALDGSLDGFDLADLLALDDELCYVRSEEPYPGAEQFAAQVWVNWDYDTLYVAVEVITPVMVQRAPDAPSLQLDNEPDDVNADGIQVYWQLGTDPMRGLLIRPWDDTLLARTIEPNPVAVSPAGAWMRTPEGYRITVAIPCDGLGHDMRAAVYFDVLVNEMREDRVRRAGQLTWSGGPGWVYLRGDRHDPSRLGVLELHE